MRFTISPDKLVVVLRGQMITSAVERRLYDVTPGLVGAALLHLAGDSVAPGPVTHRDILQQVSKLQGEASQAVTFLDQQLRVLQDDRSRLLHKVGDHGGGESHS